MRGSKEFQEQENLMQGMLRLKAKGKDRLIIIRIFAIITTVSLAATLCEISHERFNRRIHGINGDGMVRIHKDPASNST